MMTGCGVSEMKMKLINVLFKSDFIIKTTITSLVSEDVICLTFTNEKIVIL